MRGIMDRKDELILQQLETIRTMAEHSLNRMGTDFWGNPSITSKESEKTPDAEKKTADQRAVGELFNGGGVPLSPKLTAHHHRRVSDAND